MVADHQSGRDPGGIIGDAELTRGCHAIEIDSFEAKEAAKPDAASSFILAAIATRLLRPPAIVPNVGAIYPRNRPAIDIAALQRVVWNIDIENCLITFDAISHVMVHGTIP
jgi:hypothetical protein